MKSTKKLVSVLLIFLLIMNPIMVFAANGSTIVYITEYGKKYHNYGCRYLKDSCYDVTLDQALARGLEPCSVCYAPSPDSTINRSTPQTTPSTPQTTPSTPQTTPSTPQTTPSTPQTTPTTPQTEKPSVYTDLYPSAYYYNSVINLSNKGVIGGFPDGSFKPNQTVTRAQLAVMLVNANKVSTFSSSGSSFTDVPKSHWAYSFISAASNAGYLGGYPDGSFKPENPVSYNEALTMIVASLGYKASDLQGSYPKNFTDKAKEIGLLKTCSKIGTGSTTRAEVSCFLSDSFSAKRNSTVNTYKLGYYTYVIPKIWSDEKTYSAGAQWSSTAGGNVSILQITQSPETDSSYDVSFDGLMADNDNMIKAIESSAFEKVTDYLVIATDSIKGILYSGTVKGDSYTGSGWWFVFPSKRDRSWVNVICIQTNDTSYSYYDDYLNVIYSIK